MSINKITPPELGKILLRERLFDILNLSPPTSAIWISGPGGSGKTTLIASFLTENRIPCLWYQLDSGDEDLSTFFYYLGEAANRLIDPHDQPLPLLTAEYRQGVETFAQRYFENLFERLKKPCWIVFDNYQEVPVDSGVQQIIEKAIERLPKGIIITVASRSNPPATTARLQANRILQCISWLELAFTFEEFQDVIKILGRYRWTNKELNNLYHHTQGWIAGVILWLLHSGDRSTSLKTTLDNALESTFDYFGSEILDKIDSQAKDFLLRTSFLSEVNVRAANELVERKNSHDILKKLSHNNYFLEKRTGPSTVYQYHPLFLNFLTRQAERYFSTELLSDLRCRAASIAIASGDVEHAVMLYREAMQWEKLVELIQNQAPSLYFQGRLLTLSKWLGYLPNKSVADNPWLLFWQGVGHLPQDTLKGREYCANAYKKFIRSNDILGQMLSFAAAVESYFILRADMQGLDYWIGQGEKLETAVDAVDNVNISGRYAAAMLGALAIRKPGHPSIENFIERCEVILSQSTEFSLQIMLGNLLVLIYCWHGNVIKAKFILEQLKPNSEDHALAPLQQILFNVMECVYCLASGECERCLKSVEDARVISVNTGVHVYDGLICSYGVYSSLVTGDLSKTRKFLKQMADSIKPHETIDIAHYHALCAWEAYASGDLSLAQTQIQKARDIGESNGAPVATIIFGRLFHARLALSANDTECAEEHLKSILGRSKEECCILFEFQELLTQAQFCFYQDNVSKGNHFLKQAFQLSRERKIFDGNWWLRSELAFFCQKAMENDIETEQVRRFIKRHQLIPNTPSLASPKWPWPVKIYSLGRFDILIKDRPLKLSIKIPQKPLMLLKILVCRRQLGLTRASAIDSLWPDTDGDRAIQNLNTTVHRLRKILDQSNIVIMKGGKISLNSSLCWVDVWNFEDLVNQAKSAPIQSTDFDQLFKTLAIYKGHFDDQQGGNAVIIGYTERLKNLWSTAVTDLGTALIQSGKHHQAVDLLQKALALDDTVEPFYSTMMNALISQGRTAEALLTFNRCRNIMAKIGIEPADETTALYRDLKTIRSVSERHSK